MISCKRGDYQPPKHFVQNPSDSLYQLEIEPKSECAKDLIEEAADLEDRIEGDFDIDELTEKFQINRLAFVKNGLYLFKIKSLKLYKKNWRTFREFSQEILGISTWQVNRLIRAAKVVMELVCAGFEVLPSCEAQCRSLLAHAEEDLIGAWRSVVENIPAHQITAKSITNWLKPDEPESEPINQKIEVSQDLYEGIFKAALGAGLTVVGLLEEVFQVKQNRPLSWYEERRLGNWQLDLEQLLSDRTSEEL